MIGVGGCGMSGLAEVLLRRGARVSGTDQEGNSATARLARAGVTLDIASEPGPLPDGLDWVVSSAAVPPSHPQVVAARAAGCRVIKYAQLLGDLMREGVGVAVAGTHGKSTTTAWVAYTLRRAELDPTFVVGATVPQLGGGAAVGGGCHFVAEACEYDRSFLSLNFRYGVILNIEEDHLDYYGSAEEIEAAFLEFGRRTGRDGVLILNHDDPRSEGLARQVKVPVETIGLHEGATWRAVSLRRYRGCYAFAVQRDDETILQAMPQLPGRHHVYNALATAVLAHHCGVEPDAIAEALATFEGAHRRLTLKGVVRGVTILDDYAHHPTEIQATLEAACERYRPRRLWVVFQPHQHSRTRFFLEDFAGSFTSADVVVVPDIYFVRDSESDRQTVGAEDLVRRIRRRGGDARYCPGFQQIVERLLAQIEPGDAVITMGAGDIWQVADELAKRLGSDH